MSDFVASYYAGAVLCFAPDLIGLQLRDEKEGILHPGKAALFGGADEVEDGLDPFRTIRRELGEELGLAVPLVRLHYVKEYHVDNPAHGVAEKHTFIAEVPKIELMKLRPIEGHLLLVALPCDLKTLPLTDMAKTYLADALPVILSLNR